MSTKAAKHGAAGPYLGFGLQTIRLCVRLLTEPTDATVYVEHDDDVSVRYADGSKLLEQTKSAISQNPVADWSRDLWKSFHNWLEDHAPLSPSHGKRFRLYVSPGHSGAFVSAFSAAKTSKDVAALIESVSGEVTPAKRKTVAYKFTKTFLDATLNDQVEIACNFELICEDDPLESIRKLFRPSASTEVVEKVVAYALGEAKQRTDALIRVSQPAGLNAGEFQSIVRNFVQRINIPALFSFDPQPPTTTEINEKFSCRPTFVQQLELINASKDQQLNAVSDYLRAASDKTNWAVEGILLPNSLDHWTSDLRARYQAVADSVLTLHGQLDAPKKGMAIYAECRKLNMNLQGKTVPDHFTHGCFNDLADKRTIGWHPDYDELLG